MNTDNWPDWANYRTTDANGAVHYWEEKPEDWEVTWVQFKGRHEQDTTACPNWRESLRARADFDDAMVVEWLGVQLFVKGECVASGDWTGGGNAEYFSLDSVYTKSGDDVTSAFQSPEFLDECLRVAKEMV